MSENSIILSKYQGLGNDYLILDARKNKTHLIGKKVALLCRRGFGLGADGVLYGPVDINGKLGKEYRYMGWSGSGTLELHKVNSRIARLYAEGAKSGQLPEIKLDVVVTDPDAVGAQRCVLYGVIFDEFDLGSWENGAVLSESVPFKFADYEFLELIEG